MKKLEIHIPGDVHGLSEREKLSKLRKRENTCFYDVYTPDIRIFKQIELSLEEVEKMEKENPNFRFINLM